MVFAYEGWRCIALDTGRKQHATPPAVICAPLDKLRQSLNSRIIFFVESCQSLDKDNECESRPWIAGAGFEDLEPCRVATKSWPASTGWKTPEVKGSGRLVSLKEQSSFCLDAFCLDALNNNSRTVPNQQEARGHLKRLVSHQTIIGLYHSIIPLITLRRLIMNWKEWPQRPSVSHQAVTRPCLQQSSGGHAEACRPDARGSADLAGRGIRQPYFDDARREGEEPTFALHEAGASSRAAIEQHNSVWLARPCCCGRGHVPCGRPSAANRGFGRQSLQA
ncbi:hypothetical protein VTI74DRAFT_10469 [Chaetomium olivicolor]